ncbi:MAG: serine hydrolase domain-containing protein [Verrucomicrobiota bacterium]
MPKIFVTLLVLIFSVSGVRLINSAEPNQLLTAPGYDFSNLDSELRRGIDQNIVPGVSLLLLHRGRPVFAGAYGLSDISEGSPFLLSTVARIYSSSKWVSGAALAAGAEDGLYELSDTAGEYLPDYANMGVVGSDELTSPTLAELFSHSSGMIPDSAPSYDESITLQEAVDQLADIVNPLQVFPGERANYGSNSMAVAGAIIEQQAGEGFEAYLKRRLLDPLDMNNTSFNPTAAEVSRMGPVYIKLFGRWSPFVTPPNPDATNLNPALAAGLYGTIDDYARFLLMFRNQGRYFGNQILSEDSIETIRTNQIGDIPFVGLVGAGTSTRYGLGCWLDQVQENGVASFVSSTGFAGTYPWYDEVNDLAGIFFIQVSLTGGTDTFTEDVVTAATLAVNGGDTANLPTLNIASQIER